MRSQTLRKLASAVGVLALTAVIVTAAATVQMTGAGATFPRPIYDKWFNMYQSIGNIQFNYQAIGSGGGIKGVTEGTVDFGASDAILTPDQMAAFKAQHDGTNLLTFPTVLGAVVPAYNFCFTDYLSKVSAEWAKGPGRNASINWPECESCMGAKNNDGVAGLLKQNVGALGYVELIYAVKNHLAYGKVMNKSGEYVKADLKTVSAAAAAMKEAAADTQVSITDASGKGVYPISTFTWLLIPEKSKDPQKAQALKGFVKWAVTKGQDEVEALDYARLPSSVAKEVEKRADMIK